MSYINFDFLVEKEVSKFLDVHIYPELSKEFGLTFERIYDESLQHKGIDVIASHKLFKQTINIDEKTASHHFSQSLNHNGLPTFAMELESYYKNKLKIGWLFSPKYSGTDAYLFNWGWTTKAKNQWKEIRYDNILQMESMLVFKKDLLFYLDQKYDFNIATVDKTKNDYFNYRKNNNNKFFIKEQSGPYLVKSDKFEESPTNLVIPKSELQKLAKFHIKKQREVQ